ncbi:MAG TPA: hypothetical protein VGQ57_08725, partial [Polyangiaceae bacterium]|nr:hypothetical protein [Polyangiaceae bacterium]
LVALALALAATTALVFALTGHEDAAPPPLQVVAPVAAAPEPSPTILPEVPEVTDAIPPRSAPHEPPATHLSHPPPATRPLPAAAPARPARDEIQKQNPYR